MPADVNLPSATDVLFVPVVVGAQPTLEVFGQNVEAVRELARHATFISTPNMDLHAIQMVEESPRRTGLRIVRTTLASSWECVVAPGEPESGGGVAALYALHELLRSVLAFQGERDRFPEGWPQRRALAERIDRATVNLARQLGGDAFADLIDNYGSRGPGLINSAVRAAEALGPVGPMELMSANDPRAT